MLAITNMRGPRCSIIFYYHISTSYSYVILLTLYTQLTMYQHKLTLVLQVLFNITPDIICKSFGVLEIFPEGLFKLRSCDVSWIESSLMLYLSLAYVCSKKQGCKGYKIWSCSLDCIKIIFTLLAEHITLYMQAAIIHLGKMCFKRLFPEAIVHSHSGLILGMFLILTEQIQSKLDGS